MKIPNPGNVKINANIVLTHTVFTTASAVISPFLTLKTNCNSYLPVSDIRKSFAIFIKNHSSSSTINFDTVTSGDIFCSTANEIAAIFLISYAINFEIPTTVPMLNIFANAPLIDL